MSLRARFLLSYLIVSACRIAPSLSPPLSVVRSLFLSCLLPAVSAVWCLPAASAFVFQLTHGFDDEGRKYDRSGRLHPWWSNATAAAFANASSCLVAQYSAFNLTQPTSPSNATASSPPEHIRGFLTLGENIADQGGVTLSWLAMLSKLAAEQKRAVALGAAANGEAADGDASPYGEAGGDAAASVSPALADMQRVEPRLRDINDRKLFFLGYAQCQSKHTTPMQLRLTIQLAWLTPRCCCAPPCVVAACCQPGAASFDRRPSSAVCNMTRTLRRRRASMCLSATSRRSERRSTARHDQTRPPQSRASFGSGEAQRGTCAADRDTCTRPSFVGPAAPAACSQFFHFAHSRSRKADRHTFLKQFAGNIVGVERSRLEQLGGGMHAQQLRRRMAAMGEEGGYCCACAFDCASIISFCFCASCILLCTVCKLSIITLICCVSRYTFRRYSRDTAAEDAASGPAPETPEAECISPACARMCANSDTYMSLSVV